MLHIVYLNGMWTELNNMVQCRNVIMLEDGLLVMRNCWICSKSQHWHATESTKGCLHYINFKLTILTFLLTF